MFVMMSAMIPGDASPTRVAAQVVSGIGFLGGGVILREGASVRGLNTAATLWCAAAIGTLVGAGLLFQAYVGALAVVGANLILRPLVQLFQEIDEKLISHAKPETNYCYLMTCYAKDEVNIRGSLLLLIEDKGLTVSGMHSRKLHQNMGDLTEVEIRIDFISKGLKNELELLEQVVSQLKAKVRINADSWQLIEDAA